MKTIFERRHNTASVVVSPRVSETATLSLKLLQLTILQIVLGLQRRTSQHEHQQLRAIGLLTVRERQRETSS